MVLRWAGRGYFTAAFLELLSFPQTDTLGLCCSWVSSRSPFPPLVQGQVLTAACERDMQWSNAMVCAWEE